jgi:hypothetical protein
VIPGWLSSGARFVGRVDPINRLVKEFFADARQGCSFQPETGATRVANRDNQRAGSQAGG